MPIVIYGPAYSTYTRSVRLALEEKGAAYELVEVHILGGEHRQPGHLARNPFGPVPAFEHDGFALYETGAILRYVDDAVPGPALAPEEPRARARMNQIMGIVDSYAYRTMIGGVFWQRVVVPMTGGEPDPGAVEAALPRVGLCLDEIARLKGDHRFLVGPEPSLADLLLAPVLAYLAMTPEGRDALAARPSLGQWLDGMNARESMKKTQPKLG